MHSQLTDEYMSDISEMRRRRRYAKTTIKYGCEIAGRHYLHCVRCGKKSVVDEYSEAMRIVSQHCPHCTEKLLESIRVERENHPLYADWNAIRTSQTCSKRWKFDFFKFVQDLGTQPDNSTLKSTSVGYYPNQVYWLTSSNEEVYPHSEVGLEVLNYVA